MNGTPTLKHYFKSKAATASSMSAKKRNLSLRRTTAKESPDVLPITSSEDVAVVKREEDIIILSSDSEFEASPSKIRNGGISVRSIESLTSASLGVTQSQEIQTTGAGTINSSSDTFEYSLSPGTVLGPIPSTPKSSQSSRSSTGFYSPTRKRIWKNKSPVKRNLTSQFNDSFAPNPPSREHSFTENVQYKDDKTEFLITIIDKYLKTENLKSLLDEDSQVLLQNCMQVENSGMKLVCRLYWRQATWYRIETLRDIVSKKKETTSNPDFDSVLPCLVEYGLITQSGTEGESNLTLDDYIKLLKRPDLLQVAKELKMKIQSKQDAAEALRNFSKQAPISNFFTKNKVANNSSRVLEILKSKTGQCYKLSNLARTTLDKLYILMYLGIDYTIIREKKLEMILLYDKINRETYPVSKEMDVDDASVVFQDREEFHRYFEAHIIYENYLEETKTQEKCDIVKYVYNLYKGLGNEHMIRYKSLPTWLRRFTPPNIYIKIMESGVQELKKLESEEYYNLAVEILSTLIGQIAFRQHKKAEWYAEKALILHRHLDSSEKAAKVLLEGFKSEMSEEMKDVMRPRALKIANQKNIDLKDELRETLRSYNNEVVLENKMPADHIYKAPVDNYNQRGKLKFEIRNEDGRSLLTAEEYCIVDYQNKGLFTNGEHWEGRIASTIYYLLFWDIIYSKPRAVTGIFLTHYQRYPLDMFSDSFYINRKTLIDERLLFIQECTEEILLQEMQRKWDEWPQSDVSELQRVSSWAQVSAVTSCLGPRGAAALCRRLAHNYGYTRSGFPDLTLWNTNTKKIKFVEVKTDADKPSTKQLQWLQYLREHGIDAGFCYLGVHTTRARARPAPHDNPLNTFSEDTFDFEF